VNQSGILFIVCGPSGVGKTTLSHHLLDSVDGLGLSTSYTTRQPRGGEVDGEAYHFVDVARFDAMREDGVFAEWAEVHGNYYGTSIDVVETALAAGTDLLFDIDYQGAIQLREKFPDRSSAVLVIPPSMNELETRLRGRGTDSEEVVRKRLAAARHELEQWQHFDFLVKNAVLDEAFEEIRRVYHASRALTRVRANAMREMLSR